MKLLFTKNQYFKLLKLIYLGNWMINAIRTGQKGDELIKEFDELEQYIYSFAGEFGMEKYIVFEKSLGKFYPTAELEESPDIEKYRGDYDEELFWDELVNRLASRDFVEAYGEEVIEEMDFHERFQKEHSFIDKYSEEVNKHGIKRFKILDKETRIKK